MPTTDVARRGMRWAGVAALATMLLTPPTSAGASAVEGESVNPYAETGAVPGSGVGKRIGYISLGDELPFVRRVTESIIEQAAVAGAELVVCDSRFDLREAILCGRQLASQDVQGVLNFQTDELGAPEVCAAYGGLPTIAIDIHQRPCEVAFMGVDNRRAGLLVGTAMGEHVRETYDCTIDSVVMIGAGPPGETARERMDGMLDGFAAVCGAVPTERVHRFDVGGSVLIDELIATFLRSTPPGGRHVVLTVNEDAGVAVVGAARALGRADELLIASQGTDPSALEPIACDPRWIADVAYFPERYGRTLIPAMIDILDGKEVSSELFTDHVTVTAANVRELYPETPPCP
jgi:ribose transport system substrate-binding protein